MPGDSEPLTREGNCLTHDGEGEGRPPVYGGKLLGGAIGQSAVRALLIVIAAPPIELLPRVREAEEYLPIKALVSQPAIETLDVSVGLSRQLRLMQTR